MTKEEILEAAAQIIREKGFHATSMQDIAQAVDLKKASLYHHVSNKQEILVDLLDKALDILIEEMEEVVAKPLSPVEKLRLAMRSYLNTTTGNLDLASVLLLEHRSLEPKFKKRHIPRRDRYETLWREIIEEGVEHGVFSCDNPRLVVKVVLGVANWPVMWYRPEGSLSATEIADQSADLLLEGLRVR